MVFAADDADWSPLLRTKPTRPFSCTNRASGAGLGVQPSHVGLDRSSSQSALEAAGTATWRRCLGDPPSLWTTIRSVPADSASEAARRRRSCNPDRWQDVPSGQQLEHPDTHQSGASRPPLNPAQQGLRQPALRGTEMHPATENRRHPLDVPWMTSHLRSIMSRP